MHPHCTHVLFLFLFCRGLSLGAEIQPEFIPLGDLPGGVFSSQAADISSDGSVVTGSCVNAIPSPESVYGFQVEAFRWTRSEGLVGLGTQLSVRGTASSAISGNGLLIA